MKILYSPGSSFRASYVDAIAANKIALLSGTPITVTLSKIEHPKAGRSGDRLVVVDRADTQTFEVDWNGNDPTQFPQRIRAAATALFESGCFGEFRIKHKDGVIEITKT
jgi:hypothetical protein